MKTEKSGIYYIKSINNNKIYIGSSIDINGRIKKHFKELDKKIHHSKHLQRAWDLYGKDNFESGVIEYVEDKEMLLLREANWIEIFKSHNRRFGFNIIRNPNSRIGLKHSKKSKNKISENSFSKGKRYENSVRGSIPVYQYDINGNFIKKWNSIREPSDTLKITHQNIQKCMNNERISAGNFLWLKEYKGVKIMEYVKYKSVIKLDLNDNILKTYSNIAEIIKENQKYTFQCIWAVCNNKRKTAYGYKWAYGCNL